MRTCCVQPDEMLRTPSVYPVGDLVLGEVQLAVSEGAHCLGFTTYDVIRGQKGWWKLHSLGITRVIVGWSG